MKDATDFKVTNGRQHLKGGSASAPVPLQWGEPVSSLSPPQEGKKRNFSHSPPLRVSASISTPNSLLPSPLSSWHCIFKIHRTFIT